MELLGYPGITHGEERLITGKLGQLIYLPLIGPVEDEAIRLRRRYKIKLPDAIIAATALISETELLTLDKALDAVFKAELSTSGEG